MKNIVGGQLHTRARFGIALTMVASLILGGFFVFIAPALAAHTAGVEATPTIVAGGATTTEEITEPALSVEEVTTPGPQAQASLLSSLGNVLSIGTGNLWIGLFVGLILLALIAQLIYKATRKPTKKQKN